MMRRFLKWWARKLPVRVIDHHGRVFLKRYHVTTLFGYWRVYLHHFVDDDPDGLHNHPWRFAISIILAGYYDEDRRFGKKRVRWFNVVNGDKFHRVRVPYGDVWSLFIHSPRVMNWAFLRRIESPVYSRKAGTITEVLVSTRYEEVGSPYPFPHSDWWKTAPRGASLEDV